MADNARRMLDFHIERAKESMDAAGAYKIEVDRLMRYSGWHLLGTARMGDDPTTSVLDRWNRAHDVAEPVRRRRLVLRHLVRRQPDVDDRRHRAARRRPHDRDPLRAAGAGVTRTRPGTDRPDRRHARDGRSRRAATLTDDERATLAAIADHLIPAAHGMPSAAEVVTDDRLRFVLRARPDLGRAAAGSTPPRAGCRRRRAAGDALADEPTNLSALQLVIVAGYYTDKRVRELIGYPGQMALELRSWELPAYLEEGLIDAVLARGPGLARPGDRPAGRRHGCAEDLRGTLATDAAPPEGGHDGRDRP